MSPTTVVKAVNYVEFANVSTNSLPNERYLKRLRELSSNLSTSLTKLYTTEQHINGQN